MTTTLRDALAARLAQELDDAKGWLVDSPDPLGGAEILGPAAIEYIDDEDDVERAEREAVEASKREEEDRRELAAAVGAVEAGRGAIVDATERMVDALIAAAVADEALRPAVKARIRPDLVAWPTPWVRPRGFTDIETEKGPLRLYGRPGGEELEARARCPELFALARIVVEREVRRHVLSDGDDLAVMQEARRVFAENGRDVVASFAWRAIGAAAEAGGALELAARLAGVDLVHVAASGARGRRGGALRLARGDVDHVEVPGAGWVYASTLALVGHALQEATRPAELADLAARLVLDKLDDELARHEHAHLTLSRAVVDLLAKAPAYSDDVEVVEGVHPLDEALAALLHAIGEAGRDAARQVRESDKSADERANRWLPYVAPLRVPRTLALVLWRDDVRPKLQRRTSTHPALVRVVHRDVLDLLRPGLQVRNDFIVDEDGRQRMIFTQTQALDVPTVEMGAIPKLLRHGVELLGSIQAHRIVRHFVIAGHRQAIDNEADPRVLRYVGGWRALADSAGVTEQDDAKAIVVALAHASHSFPDGSHGNLLVYRDKRGTRKGPGLVSITLGDTLLPHFVYSLDQGKNRRAVEDRQLVPVVDFAPFVGRTNEQAAQASFQMMMMMRLRAGALELAKHGSVRIPDADLVRIADDAGLSTDLLWKVLDRWSQDGANGPAFLVRSGDRFTLAPAYAPALTFIEAAGRISLDRSRAGKASAARKRLPKRGTP